MYTGASSSKLKLLVIPADQFPPFRVDLAVLFAQKLVARGHKISFLMQSGSVSDEAYKTQWSGCDVSVGPTDCGDTIFNKMRKYVLSALHDFRMFGLLKSEKFDFIIVRDKFFSPLPAILLSKLFGVRLLYWLSYPFPEDSLSRVEEGTARYPLIYWLRGRLYAFLLYRVILPNAHHIFVQSDKMKENLAAHGIEAEKMTPVPMGVCVSNIPFFGNPATKQNDLKTIVYLGTLDKSRRIDFLIRSLKLVRNECEDVCLYLVGKGDHPSDELELREEARRLGVEDHLVITGFLPQDQAWRYLEYADVCVSPIRPSPVLDAGSPTKLVEYMAAGKAVVANDHPDQRTVISESRSGICVPYDEKAFADAVVYLLMHPKEAGEMGKRGRDYVEKKRDYEGITDMVESRLIVLSRNRK